MIYAQEMRDKFLNFFKSKEHNIIPSASLIPENDPTVLFTTAGMHPLVPYLLGQAHPAGKRLADVQKCVRTGDIDEVGDKTHLTFFEMLGNWSLGDYFKKESIAWSWEFLTGAEWLALSPNRLAVTVFEGDENAPFDQESYDLWLSMGVPADRIAKLGKEDNWWGPAGQTGPCGPDTEIFYWTDNSTEAPTVYDPSDKRWVEIWNNVFMAYNKNKEGQYEPLVNKNVDTGMGLERAMCAINGFSEVYSTDLFTEALAKIAELSGKTYEGNEAAFRVIADHIRTATMIIGDQKGVSPSNTDQGYVVRKLLRRAIRTAKGLGIADSVDLTPTIAKIYIEAFSQQYPEIKANASKILEAMKKEEGKFKETLEKGIRVIKNVILAMNLKHGESVNYTEGEFVEIAKDPNLFTDKLNGKWFFDMYQTNGFPFEMAIEECENNGVVFTETEKNNLKVSYEAELVKHQELSRTASAGKFKGGLADNGEATTKLHTATHLLLAALRKVLGDHVYQKGSNITAERLRLDFSHPDKMTDEQKKEVERLVNEAIDAALPISCQETTLSQAREIGAMGVFDSKYEENVKVYTVGEGATKFSQEICGGPHVANTSELGHFTLVKEEASSAGVRRIKATIGDKA